MSGMLKSPGMVQVYTRLFDITKIIITVVHLCMTIYTQDFDT